MKQRHTLPAITLFALFLILSTSTQAATVTATYYFTAMDFEPSAPQAIVSGCFTTTFTAIATGRGVNEDASLDEMAMEIFGKQYHRENTDIVVQNGCLIYNGDYVGNFLIGGKANGTDMGATHTNDFWLKFVDFGSDDYTKVDFTYWSTGSDTAFHAKTVIISRTSPCPLQAP